MSKYLPVARGVSQANFNSPPSMTEAVPCYVNRQRDWKKSDAAWSQYQFHPPDPPLLKSRRWPSQSAEQAIAAASKDLVLHWQDHAVTHGGVATGSGRELLRSAHTACISVSLDSTDLWVPTTSVFSHAVFKVRPHDLLSVAATFTSGVLVWAVAISAQFAGSSTCVCAR